MRANQTGDASKRALHRKVRPVNDAGLKLDRAMQRLRLLIAILEEFVAENREVLHTKVGEWIGYVFYIAAVIVVYIIDFWMLGGAVEYWMSLVTQTPWIVTLLKWIIPACVVIIEAVVGWKIHKASLASNDYEHNMAHTFWMTVGVALALAIPLIAIYTAATVKAVTGDSSSFLMVVVLGVLSFAGHALVLWGGELAQQAEEWAATKASHAAKAAAVEAQEQHVARLTRKFQSLVIPYVQHWKDHSQKVGAIEPGPFDARVWKLLFTFFPQLGNGDAPPAPVQK